MNMLLLNAHSPQNAGDLAILQETIACLHQAFAGAAITVAINDPTADRLPDNAVYVESFMRWVLRIDGAGEWRWRKHLTPYYAIWLLAAAWLYRLTRWRWLPRLAERRKLLSAYYDAECVVVIGGGHLYARHSANIAFAWLWLGLSLAVVMGKPLVLLPQSFGPLPGRLQRVMLRWLLTRSALVAAREYPSLRLLAEIGLRRPVLVLPDLAFTASEASAETLQAILPEYTRLVEAGGPLVGLTLMDWQGQNPQFRHQQRYEAAVLTLIRRLHCVYGARVVLFSQCTGPTAAQDDRRIARRIAAAAEQAQLPVLLVDAALAPEALKAAYRRLDVLVATRMHSAIFALSAGVPTLVIGYLHKSAGIMEMLGLERYVLNIDEVDSDSLCAAFDDVWREADTIRQRLTLRLPAMQTTLEALPALIRQSVQAYDG